MRRTVTLPTLAERTVVLRRRHQEAMATARALRHQAQVGQARRRVAGERRRGGSPGPLAWFAIEGVIDDRVVRAAWVAGRLTCDQQLRSRARSLVDLGAEFVSDDPPRRFLASLQAPPVAVLLTLIRACDRVTVMEMDLGDLPDQAPRIG
jgi:hypothetical protein